jgi:hypothetical protein
MTLYLKSWWSKEYNRPLKDPLLESYTLYDLLFEYHDKVSREKAIDLKLEQEADKIEQEEEEELFDWIEEEEQKERELLEKAQEEKKRKSEEKAQEEEEQWMLDQLKNEYGEDFGGDIDQDFSE